jgi:peptide/nickel transport system permease protein
VFKVIIQRLVSLIPIMFVVLVAVFALSEILPGDPAAIIAGEQATPASIAVVRKELGLDKPLPVRFVRYVGDLLHGDMGKSVYSKKQVSEVVGQAIPPTASLALFAMLVAILVGVPSGMIAALRRGRLFDRVTSASAAVALAIPPFMFGLILVIPLALNRSWFPATGYTGVADGFLEWVKHITLPGIALGLALAAEVTRQVRGSMVDTMEQDFIRTARANGLSSRAVVLKHGLRNAAIPVVTVIGLQAGRLLAGAVVVEGVFAIPGFGALAFSAVLGRDLPLIQGIVLVSALVVIVVNLLVDMSYVFLNPRLRT